ncbi:sodium:solute symporter [Calditrichota bacterium]
MQTINLTVWDNLAIISYFLILLFIGYKAYKSTNQKDEKDFLLANRSLSLPAFVATLVTTWYGGILGIGEFTYLHGVSTWIVFGLPYYIFAVLFAFFLAHKVRKENQFTIADLFYNRYGKKVGLLSSVFLLFMTSPAPYILMLSVLLQLIFNFSLFTSLLLGTTVSTIYVFFGGFRSVVKTDKFQFLLIYAGFLMLLIFLLIHYGDFQYLKQNLSQKHLVWHGGNSIQYILVWFFLASWTFIDPGFHQRCSAAKNNSLAKKGILISVGFWFVFDFLTISTGLYAAATLNNINPILSFPLLAESILPPVFKGLFFVGLLAIIMSTVDSFTFLSAITFGRDIVWRLKNKSSTEKINSYTKLGLFLTGLISIILCLIFPSVIKLWYIIGSLFIPPMLLPLLTGYFRKFQLPELPTLIMMSTSFLTSLSSFIWGQLFAENGLPVYPLNLEPFFPGLLASLGFYILYNTSNLFRKL